MTHNLVLVYLTLLGIGGMGFPPYDLYAHISANVFIFQKQQPERVKVCGNLPICCTRAQEHHRQVQVNDRKVQEDHSQWKPGQQRAGKEGPGGEQSLKWNF